jgi:hypothetical protein
MIEFLLMLASKGYRNALLFIPPDCRAQVRESILATMQALFAFDNVIAVGAEPLNGKSSTRFGYTHFWSRK